MPLRPRDLAPANPASNGSAPVLGTTVFGPPGVRNMVPKPAGSGAAHQYPDSGPGDEILAAVAVITGALDRSGNGDPAPWIQGEGYRPEVRPGPARGGIVTPDMWAADAELHDYFDRIESGAGDD